ncbi:HNH endonuclease family protein [Nocardioides pyridinolyticus]
MVRRVLLLVLSVALLLGAAPGSASAQETMRLRAAVRALPQAEETPTGYDRDLFEHWVDADGDCQDTREEVLLVESRVRISGCTVTTGEWFSWYDGETWTQASDVDIDHMVPLKEAWDSGARAWDDDTRERYANDLGDPRSLVAVTDNVNQSKGDRDVAAWLPELRGCRYVRHWTVVKLRWDLAVDPAERTALVDLARDCRNKRLTFEPVLPMRGGGTG